MIQAMNMESVAASSNLKFKTSRRLPITLEEFIEYTPI